MSNVEITAEREPCDLSHFVYSTGQIGRLKVLSTVPVLAGDSFELNCVGAFRLSPFRRGLSVDASVDTFTFYVPHRHSYGQEFVDLMKAGIPKTGAMASLSTDVLKPTSDTLSEFERCQFLGTHYNSLSNQIPKYLFQSYMRIYNNYFKVPYLPDGNFTMSSMSDAELRDGIRCGHLECLWSKPFNPNAEVSRKFSDVAGNDGIDIIGLNAAYGQLHTQQERDHFMQRYRDVVSAFGGKTTYDVDQRPLLLMRNNFWASGYDTDGTTQETLGQFSGRVQQPFYHRVPRFYVPEHGVIMTLQLVRFPPIHQAEFHTLVGMAQINYDQLACDPAIVANSPLKKYSFNQVFQGYTGSDTLTLPHSQYYRYHPSHVDFRYRKLQGFPFLTSLPSGAAGEQADLFSMVSATDYDAMFQTTQLGHWNIQCKMNCQVFRHIPSARDSIMTN